MATATTLVAPDTQVKLSLCMIVKNEAYFLRRCLDAIKNHVDEIIVVYTG